MSSAERHHVTVVFSDLCGSTRLSHDNDPEIVARIQSRVRQAGQAVCQKHSGVVNQHYGDGMLVVFGLPVPHESDSRRAVEFALELHDAVQRLPTDPALPQFDIQLHTGVAAGLVVADHGDQAVGVYEVVGDALNLAARLSDAAKPGEILVSAAALGRAEEFFDTQHVAPLKLKGIRELISARRVLSPSGATSRYQASERRGLTPFLGRERELRVLGEALRQATHDGFQIVNVVGASGLGKTRLVSEFLNSRLHNDWIVVRGQCDERSNAPPMESFRQILRSAPGYAGKDISDQTDAVVEQCLALANSAPTLMFVDDWQWTDDASRNVLGQLSEKAGRRPLMLITACRYLDPSDPANAGERLELAPFDDRLSEAAIEALAPGHLGPGVMRQVAVRAGGNALYLEELCQSLGDLDAAHTLSHGKLPASLPGLIEAKVRTLTPGARELATLSAVAGHVCPAWLLADLALEVHLSELEENDIAYFDDASTSLIFKHGVTREVVYSLTPLAQRKSLHNEVADAIRQHARDGFGEEPIESLAHHYAEAGRDVSCVHYAGIAGDRALASSALDQARMHYRRALSSLERLETTPENDAQWVQISKRWALASTYAPSRDCIVVLEESLRRARKRQDARGEAELNYYLGWIHYALGDQPASSNHSQRALHQADVIGAEKLVAQLLANLGQSAAAAGDYSEAHGFLDQAIGMKSSRTKSSAPSVGWAYALSCKAFVVADEGAFDQAHELMESSLSSVQGTAQAIEASILNMHTAIFLWQGRWDDAEINAGIVQRISERFNLPFLFAMSRAIESYAKWMRDGDVGSVETLRQVTSWLESAEMRLYDSMRSAWMAEIFAATGKEREAVTQANLGLERIDRGDRLGGAMSLRALARVAATGRIAGLESTEWYLSRAYEAADARGSPHERAVTQLHHARYLYGISEYDRARSKVSAAIHAFEQMNMTWYEEEAQRLLTKLGAS